MSKVMFKSVTAAALTAVALAMPLAAHAQDATISGTVVGISSDKRCFHVTVMQADGTTFRGAIPVPYLSDADANNVTLASAAWVSGRVLTLSTNYGGAACVDTSVPSMFNLSVGTP
jgi:hypothetical protein